MIIPNATPTCGTETAESKVIGFCSIVGELPSALRAGSFDGFGSVRPVNENEIAGPDENELTDVELAVGEGNNLLITEIDAEAIKKEPDYFSLVILDSNGNAYEIRSYGKWEAIPVEPVAKKKSKGQSK